jgi:hypothetical protein
MPKQPKSPQEKKRLSLERDRRNVYGENDKASRKNIPRSKARSHRQVRRTAKQATGIVERLTDGDFDTAQSTLKTPRLQKGEWKKGSDAPLGEVVQRKLKRRQSRDE